MASKKRNKFEEIQEHAGCSRHLACVGSAVRDLCDSKGGSGGGSLECLQCRHDNCEFITASDVAIVCGCPMRNYIVNNFDNFVDDSIDMIKRKNC